MKTSFIGLRIYTAAICLVVLSISTQSLGQDAGQRGAMPSFPEEAEDFSSQELHRDWEFRRDGDSNWTPVAIPSTFESHQGVGFDGVGWYRKRFRRFRPAGYDTHPGRLVLRFNGVATHATLWCDGKQLAEHLGGWTPFECDLTELMIESEPEARASDDQPQDREILLRVDELPGHNSQGFLPVFAPHFGGLWQSLQATWVSPVWIDSKELFVWGELASGKLHYEVPLGGIDKHAVKEFIDLSKRYRLHIEAQLDSQERSPEGDGLEAFVELSHEQAQTLRNEGRLVVRGSAEVRSPRLWSPESPILYRVKIGLQEVSSGVDGWSKWIDSRQTKAAFREVRVEGSRLLLNGRPLRVRGILNWGYAPPSVAPSLDPEHWRKELQLVKDYGFNLMKFCLWVPPKGYLELADQMGVLVWMEYPTWHSQWTKDALPKLEKEFDEFFCYDRNHPSVVLRSLTCETGPSADLDVIRTLYDRCHWRIPGSIVEDDSSWIQWNRVHDFYDDHPYGNNHTWVPTLHRLNSYIREHGVKPLVLGEAIAADTWLPPGSLDGNLPDAQQAVLQGVRRAEASDPVIEPFWFPLAYRANERWAQERAKDMGAGAVERLERDSKRYALQMRKYQIEALHRELPDAGYVVSVIRDFPFASMGLVDFNDRPKWTAEEWNWHSDRVLVLKTPEDRKSFWAGEPLQGQVLIDSLSESQAGNYLLRWTWTSPRGRQSGERVVAKERDPSDAPIELLDLQSLNVLMEKSDSAGPTLGCFSVELIDRSERGVERKLAENSWDLWFVDKPAGRDVNADLRSGVGRLFVHDSCSGQTAKALGDLAELCHRDVCSPGEKNRVGTIWIAQKFDERLLEWLEQGGLVLMLPDGQKGSLPIGQHWFLKGGPIIADEPFWNRWHRMLIDLQHFDLAGQVVPDIQWLDDVSPLVMLWDNHDVSTVKTHGLVFASRIGSGTLLVDCLNHTDTVSPASVVLFSEMLGWLESTQGESAIGIRKMQPSGIQAMREKLRERTYSLTEQAWSFRPDPKNQGVESAWHLQKLAASEESLWDEISIGKHWEAQGYGDLDGWAWYRKQVVLPSDWPDGPLYLQVDGADDYIEVYSNGTLVGTAGDRVARKTAFEQKVGLLISRSAKAGDAITIAIRVEDWQGAGGLFRPIRLSTSELSDAKSILK